MFDTKTLLFLLDNEGADIREDLRMPLIIHLEAHSVTAIREDLHSRREDIDCTPIDGNCTLLLLFLEACCVTAIRGLHIGEQIVNRVCTRHPLDTT